MARIRSLKPEAFTSETLARVSVHARWTFGGLWTYVDDEGRGLANANLIKAAIWPLDDEITPKRVNAFLRELETEGLICRYEDGGKNYLHVVNFGEHQHPNRPAASRLPACTRSPHGALSEGSVSPHKSITNVSVSRKSPQTGHDLGEHAGQQAFTEPSVSPHGALTTNPSSTPPTPTTREGVGVGEGVVEEIPPSAGSAPAQPTAQTVLASFIDWDRANGGTLTKRTTGQLAKSLGELLGQNIPERHIRNGLADWRASGQNPSTLDSFVNARMRGAIPNGRGSPGALRAQQALDAGANVQAALDRGELTL